MKSIMILTYKILMLYINPNTLISGKSIKVNAHDSHKSPSIFRKKFNIILTNMIFVLNY